MGFYIIKTIAGQKHQKKKEQIATTQKKTALEGKQTEREKIHSELSHFSL